MSTIQHVPARSTRVCGLLPTTMRLTRARFAAREGEGLLYGAAVLGYTVTAAIVFTIAGGTWMFFNRAAHPTGLHALLSTQRGFSSILEFYVGLAFTACALVLPSAVTLAGGSSQLGARGRERRLAALRLLGLSSGDVTRMALLDAVYQSAIGTALGAIIYAVTLPAWQQLSFQAMPIRPGEMLLPWWLALALVLTLPLLAVVASAWGLRQVRISPLGVSRRANKPAARVWRAGVAVVLIVLATVGLSVSTIGRGSEGFMMLVAFMGVLVVAVDLAGPWVIQLIALVMSKFPSATVMWASRRVIANPVGTWRRVASMGLLAFVAAFLGRFRLPFDTDLRGHELTFAQQSQIDLTQGAVITLGAGFLLTATAMLIGQASNVIERAEQSRSLHKMGAPDGFSTRVMWLETFGPLATSVLMNLGLGYLAGTPLHKAAVALGSPGDSTSIMVGAVAAGLTMSALALLASHPLHRRLLGVQERRND